MVEGCEAHTETKCLCLRADRVLTVRMIERHGGKCCKKGAIHRARGFKK